MMIHSNAMNSSGVMWTWSQSLVMLCLTHNIVSNIQADLKVWRTAFEFMYLAVLLAAVISMLLTTHKLQASLPSSGKWDLIFLLCTCDFSQACQT
jgi:hypothetical protein